MSNAKPLARLIDDRVIARFNAKWVEDKNGCWVWTAGRFPSGYGQIRIAGSTRRAHRVGYVIAYGDPPLDLTLDHLCRVRHCVNPAHLEAVTIKVNTLRGDTVTAERAARTECPRGHSLLDPANLDPSPLRRGVRSCLTCRRDRDRINNRGQQELISRAHKSLGMTQREYETMDGTAQVSTVGALIGYRLRDLRKRHKVTQGQVADKVSALLGGDPDETEPIAKAITISMIERGERDVAVWELGALATALRLHPHYLLDTTGVDVAPDVARYADAYGCADKPSPSAQPWEMPAETDEERAARRKRSAEILESRLLRALKSDGIETAEGLREIVWDLNESDAFEWREDLVTKRRQRDGEDPWGANNKDLSTLRMEATKAMIHEMRDARQYGRSREAARRILGESA